MIRGKSESPTAVYINEFPFVPTGIILDNYPWSCVQLCFLLSILINSIHNGGCFNIIQTFKTFDKWDINLNSQIKHLKYSWEITHVHRRTSP